MPSKATLTRAAKAVERKQAADLEVEKANAAMKARIRTALADGHGLRAVARGTGLSTARVAQIRDEA